MKAPLPRSISRRCAGSQMLASEADFPWTGAEKAVCPHCRRVFNDPGHRLPRHYLPRPGQGGLFVRPLPDHFRATVTCTRCGTGLTGLDCPTCDATVPAERTGNPAPCQCGHGPSRHYQPAMSQSGACRLPECPCETFRPVSKAQA